MERKEQQAWMRRYYDLFQVLRRLGYTRSQLEAKLDIYSRTNDYQRMGDYLLSLLYGEIQMGMNRRKTLNKEISRLRKRCEDYAQGEFNFSNKG